MWPAIIAQLIQVVAPIVLKMVADHAAANNGQLPTEAELRAKLQENANTFLATGDAWLAAHPERGTK